MVVMVAIRTLYSKIWAIYNSAMDSMGKSFLDVPFSLYHKSKRKEQRKKNICIPPMEGEKQFEGAK